MNFIEKIIGIRNNASEPEQEKKTDSAAVPPQETNTVPADETASKGTQERFIPYTSEELENLLAEKKQEWQEEQSRMEQERIQSLPETERLKQELLIKEKEISRLKAEQEKQDLKAEVIAKLEERRLPASIADILTYSDRESTFKSFDKVISVFETAVQEGVNNRLRGKTPEGIRRTTDIVQRLVTDTDSFKTDEFSSAFSKALK